MSDIKRYSDTVEDASWASGTSTIDHVNEADDFINTGFRKYSGPFNDPVYQQLSFINGKINKMTKEQIIGILRDLRLDVSGSSDILKKRLKNFYKEEKLTKAHLIDRVKTQCSYKFICVIDFEATCEEENESDYPHEIIEFPAVLVDTVQRKIVDEFHEYCRPVINPELSTFCKNLTGITQEQVDQAETFPVVVSQFVQWLKERNLGISCSYAICTDGPWDMGRFLLQQCKMSEIQCPAFSKRWINIRKSFSNFYKTRRMKLHNMLELLDMKFEGRPHCGMDDARNIARVVIKMLEDGAELRVNENMRWNSLTHDDSKIKAKSSRNLHNQNSTDYAVHPNSKEHMESHKKKEDPLEDTILQIERLEVDPEVAGTEKVLLRGRFAAKKYL